MDKQMEQTDWCWTSRWTLSIHKQGGFLLYTSQYDVIGQKKKEQLTTNSEFYLSLIITYTLLTIIHVFFLTKSSSSTLL